MSALTPGDITESQRLGLTAHIRSVDGGFEVYNLAHGHLFRTVERFRCVIFADGWNEAVDRLVDDPAAVGGVVTELEALSQRILDEIPRRSAGVADGLRMADGWISLRAAALRAAALRAAAPTTDGDAEMSAAERATEMAKAGAAGHVSGLSLGDIVTVEPPLGVVLKDEGGGLWKHLIRGWCYYRTDGRRHERLIELSWDTVYCARPLVVAELPGDTEQLVSDLDDARVTIRALVEPTVTSGEQWENVTLAQVRLGDTAWLRCEFDGGLEVTYRGPVTSITLGSAGDPYNPLGLRLANQAGVRAHDITSVRRRPRTPMAEPDPPAVVKHAGRILARAKEWAWCRWTVLDGERFPDGELVGKWPEVLAMDPTTDPVLVDLGGQS